MTSNDTYISRKGYTIYKNKLTDSEKNNIETDLKISPYDNSYNVFKKEYLIYLQNPAKYYLPRYYGIKKFGKVNDIRFNNISPIDESINDTITLRQHQLIPYKKCLDTLKKDNGCILCLGCGNGKTIIALKLLLQLRLKTLIVVHKTFLLNQWIERINMFIKNCNIGIIQGKKCEFEDKDIVIGMLQSLSMKDYDTSIFDNFGLVIYDEVHHLSAETFSKALPKVATKYLLGLSATPNRKDGLSKVFKYYIGNIIKFKNFATPGKNVNVKIYNITDDNTSEYNKYSNIVLNYMSKPVIPKMITNICEYEQRNSIIVKVLKELLNDMSRKILVLSDRRQHLVKLSKYLNEPDYGFYIGGMKQHLLDNSTTRRVILSTYMMTSEAFDVPELNTLILCTPKSDVVQIVGRILRKEHTISPVIIDFNDNFSVFSNQFNKRLNYYHKCKYSIIYPDKSTKTKKTDDSTYKKLNIEIDSD